MLIAIGLAMSAAGCGEREVSEVPRATSPSAIEASVEQVVADADARTLSAPLRSALNSSDAALRGLAVRAAGMLEDEGVVPLLELALADREAGIRLDAARALARHPALGSAARQAALLGALAAARDPQEQAALLGLLADAGSSAAAPWLTRALRSAQPLEQQAACLAVQRLADRGHAPAATDVLRAVELMERGGGAARGACAAALAEPVVRETIRTPELAERVRLGLVELMRSADAEDAVLAVRALAADPSEPAARELSVLLGSTSSRIALEAARGLATRASPATLRGAVERELEHLGASGSRTARAGVLLELLAALERFPDAPDTAAAAQRAMRISTPEPGATLSAELLLERGFLHCAGARLADAVRHWPKELLSCGHGQVPDAVRDVWVAQAFAAADGSDDLRALQLTRLFEKSTQAARMAVLAASAMLPVPLAGPLVRSGLRHADPLVRAVAAEQLAARRALTRAPMDEPLGVDDVLAAGDSMAEVPALAIAWLKAARAVGRSSSAAGPDAGPIKPAAGSTGSSASELSTAVQVVETAPPSALIERVTQLARHPAPAVRGPATALLGEWEARPPSDSAPVDRPLAADRVPSAGTLFHVKLRTTAGPIELELSTDRAPVAAVRFVELVRSGALDGLPVAQVSRGRAVSFLPQAAGALRHESFVENATRGSVLLQDHGRDALGPGFVLLLERAPDLDRRAVAFGRIVRGHEVADRLLPVDLILEAVVTMAGR